MAKFLIGLILGIFIGALAAAWQPNVPDGLRAGLANVTRLVARGTERAAESVNRAAGNLADQADRARQEPPPEQAPQPANDATR